jgi:hypothetical protein
MAATRAGLTLGQPQARAKFTESIRFPQVLVLVIHHCSNVEIIVDWRRHGRTKAGSEPPDASSEGLGDGPRTRAGELDTRYLEQDRNFVVGESAEATRSSDHRMQRCCESPP